MSIDWIIAAALLNAPDVIKETRDNKRERANTKNYEGLIQEFWVGKAIEMGIMNEVANPENYDRIWETIEMYLLKNPIMLASCWRDCWGFVGRERLQCHHRPDDVFRGITDEIIQANREKTAAILATIYGGHTYEKAKELAYAIVYQNEIGNRTSCRHHGSIQDRGPIFPDME